MKYTYQYTVEMLGFTSVTGHHKSSRSHDAEVAAIRHFLEVNDIDYSENPNDENYDRWDDRIRFYAPRIKLA